jgi:thiol-disulfide isomerase/thioredoxin
MSLISRCPKCKYIRGPEDVVVPAWQCPKCGVAYAKFEEQPLGVKSGGYVPNETHFKNMRNSSSSLTLSVIGIGLFVLLALLVYQVSEPPHHEAERFPHGITQLSNNINQYIHNSNGYLLVHFSSYDSNCGYCIDSNDFYDELANKYSNRLKIARITWEPWSSVWETSPAITKQYAIRALPMHIFYKDGREIWRAAGDDESTRIKLNRLIHDSIT